MSEKTEKTNRPRLPRAVTLESLTESHGERAAEIFNEISRIGGYGFFADSGAALDLTGLHGDEREKVRDIFYPPAAN